MLCCVTPQRRSSSCMAGFEDKVLELLDDTSNGTSLVDFQKRFNAIVKRFLSCEDCLLFRTATDDNRACNAVICEVVGTNELTSRVEMHETSKWQRLFGQTEFSKKRPWITLPSSMKQHVDGLCKHVYPEVLAFQLTSQFTFVGVVCLLYKAERRPSPHDLHAFAHLLRVVSPFLAMLISMEQELRNKEKSESLLRIARNLFGELENVEKLIKSIVEEAKRLTSAECCSLFLYDDQRQHLMAQVFDTSRDDRVQLQEVTLPADRGIAGYVARSGAVTVVHDAYADARFYPSIDELTGFRTRNILCVPVTANTETIGVLEMCNKLGGSSATFSKGDADFALAFASYCALAILHSKGYRQIYEAQQRSTLANELMMYHMKVNEDDVRRYAALEVLHPSALHSDFASFAFFPRKVLNTLDDTLVACVAMFNDLGFVERWKLNRESLVRFLLMVQKGYRSQPYHNWMHAFSVAHYCYSMLTNVRQLKSLLSDLERFCLFVACLAHDIDHRGRSNSFQLTQKTVLAQLYSSAGSVMEQHHFRFTVAILSCDGCNVLDELSTTEYQEALDVIQHVILSTDLASHVRTWPDVEKMLRDGYDPHIREHRKLLLSLLVRACDISDQSKHWVDSKAVAALVYEEFFSEGDELKERTSTAQPLPMMDRERACIPQVQIEFLQTFPIPIFRSLYTLLPDPETGAVYQRVLLNLECWTQLRDLVIAQSKSQAFAQPSCPHSALEVLFDAELEALVLQRIGLSAQPIGFDDDVTGVKEDDSSTELLAERR